LASRLARPDDAVAVGREWGSYLAVRESPRPGTPTRALELLAAIFERLGFDPITEENGVTFANCPFRELAEAYPELICSLHRGLCEGLVDACGGTDRVAAFHPLGSPDPCLVVLAAR
jgi:predicted ArsR family transcriptional regulator